MKSNAVDIAVIGAGPYGLSLAANLKTSGRTIRVFGSPMRSWSHHMPRGMHLKSEGFASNLSDANDEYTLERYCREQGIPYADIGLPVAIETFINYGRAFQQRHVPQLEDVQITHLRQASPGFELTTAEGETFRARRVVVAAGIVNFAYLPPMLAALPDDVVTHSSRHHDMDAFKGKKVAVLGAGASAIDIAALLAQAGAQVEIVARRAALAFQEPPEETRSLWQRITAPRSGLGIGWRSRMCTDIPLVFHAMPKNLRIRAVARHLGPAPCWFTREAVEGRIPTHLSSTVTNAEVQGGGARLSIRQPGRPDSIVEADHLIAATGYKADVSRLKFLDESVRSRIHTTDQAPTLNRQFESSVPGLYFIGAAAAISFGPLLRFAYGARFAAKRVSAHLRRAA